MSEVREAVSVSRHTSRTERCRVWVATSEAVAQAAASQPAVEMATSEITTAAASSEASAGTPRRSARQREREDGSPRGT